MGDEVWVKPPVYSPSETSILKGDVMAGNLGWFNNTGDRAFGPVVYVRPLDGQEWYEQIVERDWLGRVKSRRWVIAKATLDSVRNAFYHSWNSLYELGCPDAVMAGELWESPWGFKLGLDECMELATLMAGLSDWSGWDHINEIYAEMQNIDKGETDE
jgi:hypothetical protein